MRKPLLGFLLFMGSTIAAYSQAVVDSHLQSALANPTMLHQVVVTFQGDGAPSAANLQLLKSLGILNGRTMHALPVAGIMATTAQVNALSANPSVVSVYLNRSLQQDNDGATALTGVQRARLEPVFTQRNGGLPVSGRGIGVLVNDSGIDGTHPDLKLGQNLKQNVLGTTNLQAQNDMLPITYVEDVPNTDQTGGHGTHVAGIVGATGAASNGKFAGVAPGADLIGYGTGAGLFILDVVGAFDYALTHQFQYNIRVITNSFGTTSDIATDVDPTNPIAIATKKCVDRNMVVVFSAGNSGAGSGTITGSYKKAPWVICVANSDKAGVLAPSSSRGRKGVSGNVTIGGQTLPWRDEPTITAPGTDIVSTRTVSPVGVLSTQKDAETIPPAQLPFYTTLTGTSMAAPHIAGIVALMLDANPNMTPAQVKTILEETATNLPNRESWEVGQGMANAYAAIDRAYRLAGYGPTVNARRAFFSTVNTAVSNSPYTINFNPATTATNTRTFSVPTGTSSLEVSCKVSGLLGETGNPVNLVLLSPSGKRYASGISVLFALSPGRAVAVAGPESGTWTIRLEGLQGAAIPETVAGTISLNQSQGTSGLNDVASHPAKASIEMAIGKRLMDGQNNGFKPDQNLSRIQLADYLMMGQAIRQALPLNGQATFTDVSADEQLLAQSVTNQGAALRDRNYEQNGVMLPVGAGKFGPNQAVDRASLAYSLVQSLGLQNKATQSSGQVTVEVDGKRLVIEDADQIPAGLAGYVQVALDMNIINAFYSVTQGPYDLKPVLHATFKPAQAVKRADFAVIVTRTHDQWTSAPKDVPAGSSALVAAPETAPAKAFAAFAAPNPFSDRATLNYYVAQEGPVSLELYDLMGRKVQTLVKGAQSAGYHEQAIEGSQLPAGTYLFKLRANKTTESGRLVLTH